MTALYMSDLLMAWEIYHATKHSLVFAKVNLFPDLINNIQNRKVQEGTDSILGSLFLRFPLKKFFLKNYCIILLPL